MAETKPQKAVVFVSRAGIQFFGVNSKSIPAMAFDVKATKDLDIIDSKLFGSQIQGFIDQNKLPPSPVLFVFADNVCFSRDINEADLVRLKEINEDFVNNVPFDTLLTKVYKTKTGVRIVSTNERLYREIASAFESRGFLSLGVIPVFILGGKMGLAQGLDFTIGRQVLMTIETLKEQSFFSTSEVKHEEENEEPQAPTKASGKPTVSRNMILLGVLFAVLMAVLLFLIFKK